MNAAARSTRRGSMLVSAMLFTAIIAIGLTGYLSLSTTSLRLSQRTFYRTSVAHLAEAGLEEALYSYRLVDLGTLVATAWNGWSLAGGNASLTLPGFTCGSHAIGTVKVFVTGYDGSLTTPSIISQATIVPLDGNPPVTKTLKLTLQSQGGYNGAIVTSTSLALGNPRHGRQLRFHQWQFACSVPGLRRRLPRQLDRARRDPEPGQRRHGQWQRPAGNRRRRTLPKPGNRIDRQQLHRDIPDSGMAEPER